MKTVSNYMREMGIKACYIKHWTKTTISKNFTADLKNLLKREFNPDRPNAFWCTDITYIWTYDEGFCLFNKCNGFIFKKNHILGIN